MKLRTKRVYVAPAAADGQRILIDRLWPRGLSKSKAEIDFWARAIAPSTKLRQWYKHDPAKWNEFRRRYFAELNANPEGVAEFRSHLRKGIVTIVFSSKEERLNNATALKEYFGR